MERSGIVYHIWKFCIQPLEKFYICPNFLPFLASKLIRLLTLKVMTTSSFAQMFCLILASKLIRLLTLKVMNTPYLPKFFALFSIKIDSLTYFESHDYPLCCPIFLPFLASKLIHLLWQSWLPPLLPKFFALFNIKTDLLTNSHDYPLFCPIYLPFSVRANWNINVCPWTPCN